MDIVASVAKELNFKVPQVENTIKLFDEGATVPFIARYRKEVTGNLDEEQIRDVIEKITYYRNLEKRKEEVIRLIEEQGKLTEELHKSIVNAMKLQEVEDLYLPYKKKKKTKADIAKDQGLEPLSEFALAKGTTMEQLEKEAEKYVTEEVADVKAAIEGVHLIIAQDISENIKIREFLRDRIAKFGILTSKVIEKNKENDEKGVYQDYYEYSEQIGRSASNRILALNRGEKEKILKVDIDIDEKTEEVITNFILNTFENKNLTEFFKEVIKDSLDRLAYPSIKNEVRNIYTEKAEEEAINIFSENLEKLLLQPPLSKKTLMGLDPGYRTGCKMVIINKYGFYETNDVLFLVDGVHNERQLAAAKKKILDYIAKYDVDIIAIGNGTASRETEAFVADVIKDSKKKVSYLIANEAGASIYSASKIAIEEFPDLDVTARGAISIARRIQDPMAELVKIDPKSIGVGMYQHDVNQKKLNETLEQTIEHVVNNVGVNINTASWALLSFVSGIKKNVAKNLVDYRHENGDFKDRKQLKKVKGLGDKAFEQMAGFVVVPDSKNPLDNTIIHPESYHIAEIILKEAGCKVEDLKEDLDVVRQKLQKIDLEKIIKENDFGRETAKDVYEALLKDRRDPRDEFEKPLLRSDVLNMDDLTEGMVLEGTVRNVAKFGAFVDIGLKNDALIHISEIAEKFVSDATKELSVGQIIKVKILSLDKERGRVGLTRKGL
ncbi:MULTISPECIES: Tex family protein [unclassified Leptotrichia]|uniref:Tex family protein n=1 Tax=unclassified Leptotrichia TaxID=2633022 RepID=UPI0003ADBEFD|nr:MULTISPECIES: Tex family protein [unclassified Leptotrichia]ERL27399.1 Tex-like protein [Leptotrichia sp. oral taxon 225 str. F0581]WLD74123.1 Tex family protein [Leptotrichia sp. HMT-225]